MLVQAAWEPQYRGTCMQHLKRGTARVSRITQVKGLVNPERGKGAPLPRIWH